MKKTVYGFVLGLAAFVLGAGFYACDTGSLENLISDPVYTVTGDGEFEGGSVALTPAKAAAGAVVIITVTPKEGFRLAAGGLTVNGGAITPSGSGNIWTFTMPAGDVKVAAAFETLPDGIYGVTAGVFDNGSVAADPASAAAGETVTLTVTPAAGYRLTEGSLTVNGGAAEVTGAGTVFTFTMPAGNVTVAAAFEALETGTYSVTIGYLAGGSVAADPAFAAEGETVTLTVSPAAAHRLVAGSLAVKKADGGAVAAEGAGNTWTFEMPAGNVTVTAAFEALPPDQYSVTVGVIAGGKIAASRSSAKEGDEVVLTASPNTDYQYETGSLAVTDAGGGAVTVTPGSGNTFTFTMPADDVAVTAQFTAILYQVNFSSMTHGAVSASPASAAKGETVTLTASPAAGYRLAEDGPAVTRTDGGTVAVKGAENTWTFTMPSGGATVAAAFEELPAGVYSVNIGTFTGGKVETNKPSAQEGETVTLTVTPDADYQYAGKPSVTSGGKAVTVSGSGPWTFTMPAGNVAVTAQFTAITYKITVGTFTGGAVSANPANAAKGTEVTLTVTQNANYQLKANSLKANNGAVDVTQSGGSTWTFKMPAGDVTVTAAFEELEAGTYSVTIIQSPGGKVVADKLSAKQMETVTITVTPDPGYERSSSGLTVTRADGGYPPSVTQSDGKYTFNMYTGGVTVTAQFTAIPYTINSVSSGNGSVISAPTTAIVGTEITVTTSPASGEYRLAGSPSVTWSGGTVAVSGSGSSWKFTMPPANATVMAQFEAITYAATIPSMPNGSVSANPASAAKDAVVTLTVSPNGGYQLAAGTLKVNGTAVNGPPYTFTMPSGGVTVAAAFETVAPDTYTITIPSVANGTVTASHASTTAGTTVTLTVTPASGDYQLQKDSLTFNGTIVSGPPYTFTMPASHVTVAAVFEEAEVDVPPGYESYIQIDSAEKLAKIANSSETDFPPDGNYIQVKNIVLTGEWTPIGTSATKFTGKYNGNNKVITPNNVTIAVAASSGIFGEANNAKFENIKIGDGKINITGGSGYHGGIVGEATNGTTITNCSNEANLITKRAGGGICGQLSQTSSITGCWNAGTITCSGNYGGGICGSVATSSTIKNSYNSGPIQESTVAASGAGGIAGQCTTKAEIVACYNTGNVTAQTTGIGTLSAGGICGSTAGSDSGGGGKIIACYNWGTVSSDSPRPDGATNNSYIGGISGYTSRGNVVITASYSIGTVLYKYEGEQNKGKIYVGGISGCNAYNESSTPQYPVITACYWKVTSTETGIGQNNQTQSPDNVGTTQFSSDAWPSNGQSSEWGTGNGEGSGQYWKNIGSWNNENPEYPRLWFEN